VDIQIEPPTLQRAVEKGASKLEIIESIENGTGLFGKKGDSGKPKFLVFENLEMANTKKKKNLRCILSSKMIQSFPSRYMFFMENFDFDHTL